MGVAVTIEARLAAPVLNGEVVFFNYPRGFDQADFIGEKASAAGTAIVDGNDIYAEADGEVSLDYGVQLARLTNLSGLTWPAGVRVRVQLAYRDFAAVSAGPGDGGLTISDVNAAIDGRIGEIGAPINAATLTTLLEGAAATGGTDLTNLGSAYAKVMAAAGPTERRAVLTSFETLTAQDKAAHMGAMMESVNAGEIVILDDLRRASGIWFVPPSVREMILGSPEIMPPDPEAIRAPDNYQNVTAAIAAGALTIDLADGRAWNFDFSAALNLRFAIPPAGFPPLSLVAAVRATNTHATLARDLTFISGGGFAGVALHAGLESPLSIANGATVTLHVETDNAGGMILTNSDQVQTGAALSAPVVTNPGVIVGGGKIGTEQTVAGTSVTGNPVPGLTYVWERGGTPIGSATAASYTPVAADNNTNLTRVVTATNSQGADSDETAIQAITYNAPIAADGLVAQTFNANSGTQTYNAAPDFTVAGDAGLAGVTWTVPGAPTGVTINASGVVQVNTATTGALVASTITVRATNSGGFDESTFPLTIETIPVITAAGTIAGGGKIGTSHTVSGLTVTGNPTPALTYVWERGGTPISGATSAAYTPVAADNGTNLTRVTTATNSEGADTEETAAQAITYNAPVAADGLVNQTFSEDTGVQTYDAHGDFSVAGDAALAGVTWSLTSPPTGVTINSAGVVQVNTATTGPLTASAITVRATNSGGFDESVFNLTVGASAAVGFIGQTGTNVPADTVAVNAATDAGDLVIAVAGHSTGLSSCVFNAATTLEDANNGTNVSFGSSKVVASGPSHVLTAAVAGRHRMRTFTFENADEVASADPTFEGADTSVAFPSVTIPAGIQGRARILCVVYTPSANGGFTPPAGFTTVSSNSQIAAMLSDATVSSFAGATATLGNSVIKAMQTFAIG